MIVSTSQPARAVIIGAGAVGSHLAACLRHGSPLLIVDRDERVRTAFTSRGIDAAPPLCPADLHGLRHPGFFREGDIAVLTTSASVAALAAGSIPSWVPIVCLSNGLTPDLAAARASTLSYGVVEFAVSTRSPGDSNRAKAGWLTLQRTSPGNATAWLAGILDPRLQRTRLTDNIDAHRRSKLMLNASLDPVAAVIGGSIGDVFRGRESFRAFRVLLREALAVARASQWSLRAVQGVRPDVMSSVFGVPLLQVIASRVAARQARHVASTLAREVHRGDLGEAEHLSGAIASEGARVGIATPGHMRAMELLRRIAAQPGGHAGHPSLARELIQH